MPIESPWGEINLAVRCSNDHPRWMVWCEYGKGFVVMPGVENETEYLDNKEKQNYIRMGGLLWIEGMSQK